MRQMRIARKILKNYSNFRKVAVVVATIREIELGARPPPE